MERTKKQLFKDIQFCKNVLGLSPEDTDNMIMVCDKLKIGAEYFSEEFVFEGDGIESVVRVHDPEYLKIKWRLA
tara:strand:+ start:241 stop:462 length:222 start_codon:yes stop_codon:yes gene_type:complete